MSSSIEETYINTHQCSRRAFERASQVFPGGVTRDVNQVNPFPLYISHGKGAYVWDLDSNSLVDLVLGNGSLILGHGHPKILEAGRRQIEIGTHLGGATQQEIEWADKVVIMIPSAEKVRFTTTGSEATHLAIRLARSYTGKSKVLRIAGHFHGWHDGLAIASSPDNMRADSAGVPAEIESLARVCPQSEGDILQALTEGNIAAIILEASGGKAGLFPFEKGVLEKIFEQARRHDVLIIFDEVITGFRWSSGGLQLVENMSPDLTTLGKILGGGNTCGAVVGTKQIMDQLAIRENQAATSRSRRVHHGGTFSGNLAAACTGVAMLSLLENGDIIRSINEKTTRLKISLNELWSKLGLPGGVYGESSVFHISFESTSRGELHHQAGSRGLYSSMQKCLANNGVLMRNITGMLSSAHSDTEIGEIVYAFDRSLQLMKKEYF